MSLRGDRRATPASARVTVGSPAHGIPITALVEDPRASASRRTGVRPIVPHATHVRRITAAWHSAMADGHDTDWYWRAQREVARLAERHGVPLCAATGVISALSPGTLWERNIEDADALLRGDWEWPFTTYGANVRKAAAIALARTEDEVLTALGRGHKTVAFYMCIMDPRSRAVVVDRHAIGVALGRKPTLADRTRFARARQYGRIAAAYQLAADRLGVIPSQLQSATWSWWRAQRAQRAHA